MYPEIAMMPKEIDPNSDVARNCHSSVLSSLPSKNLHMSIAAITPERIASIAAKHLKNSLASLIFMLDISGFLYSQHAHADGLVGSSAAMKLLLSLKR